MGFSYYLTLPLSCIWKFGHCKLILLYLFLCSPLKVAKSPNLRRLSRDLLLEILDAIADYLKDSNIAVHPRWGVFRQDHFKSACYSCFQDGTGFPPCKSSGTACRSLGTAQGILGCGWSIFIRKSALLGPTSWEMPLTLLHDEARTRGRRRSYHNGAQFRDSWVCPNLVSMKVYAFLSLLDVLKPWGFIYYKPERLTEHFEITTFSYIFVCNFSLFSGFGTTRKSQFQRLFVVIRAANLGSINCLMTTILKKFEWEVFFFICIWKIRLVTQSLGRCILVFPLFVP